MKVLCVGRNYAAHAAEMGAPVPAAPIWFWKPDTAIIQDGADIVQPAGLTRIDHEVELAVRLGKPLRRADAAECLRAVDALTVANDVTARELQEAAKKAGTPWAQAKGYDTFLPLGEWTTAGLDRLGAPDLRLRLTVDGQLRQDGRTREMVRNVGQLLAHGCSWTTLRPGDILLTGTPEGVGPMPVGSTVEAAVVGVAKVRNRVVAE